MAKPGAPDLVKEERKEGASNQLSLPFIPSQIQVPRTDYTLAKNVLGWCALMMKL